MVCCSAAPLLLHEYFYQRYYRDRPVPLAWGICLAVCLLAFRISSAFTGAVLAVLALPAADTFLSRVRTGAGLLAGMWAGAILLQLAQNSVLRRLGLPARRVSFIRTTAAARKK